jgi:serine/threonine protein kinase
LESRGVSVAPELEALVRACLEKKPDRRPQSAAELRKRLESCALEPWDADKARHWWREHQSAFDRPTPPSLEASRTIAVGERSVVGRASRGLGAT